MIKFKKTKSWYAKCETCACQNQGTAFRTQISLIAYLLSLGWTYKSNGSKVFCPSCSAKNKRPQPPPFTPEQTEKFKPLLAGVKKEEKKDDS